MSTAFTRRGKGSPLSADDHDKTALITRGYPSVKSLLDNTTDTYAFWQPGDRLRAGDHVYEVIPAHTVQPAATITSLNHHLATAGGLKVQPVQFNTFNVQAWGVFPDGVNHHERMQRLLRYILAADRDAVVEFPAAATPYILDWYSFQGRRSVTLRGVGGKAHLRRTDGWNNNPPEGWKPTTTFENLIIDGNRWGNTGFDKSFSHQHCHGINCMGVTASEASPRSHVVVRNCDIINIAGDGVCVFHNTDVELYNTLFKNCFRGGVTFVGSNFTFKARDCTSDDDLEASTRAGYEGQALGFHSGWNDEAEGWGGASGDVVMKRTWDVDGWTFKQGYIKLDHIPHGNGGALSSHPTDMSNLPHSVFRRLVTPDGNHTNRHQIMTHGIFENCDFNGRIKATGQGQKFLHCTFRAPGRANASLFPKGTVSVAWASTDLTDSTCFELADWSYNGQNSHFTEKLASSPVEIDGCRFLPSLAAHQLALGGGTVRAISANSGSSLTQERSWRVGDRRRTMLKVTNSHFLALSQGWRNEHGMGPDVFCLFDHVIRIAGVAVHMSNNLFEAKNGIWMQDTVEGMAVADLSNNEWFTTQTRLEVRVENGERAALVVENDTLDWCEFDTFGGSSTRSWSDRKIIVRADPNGGIQQATGMRFGKYHRIDQSAQGRIVMLKLPVRAIVPGSVTLACHYNNNATARLTLSDKGDGTLVNEQFGITATIDYTAGIVSNWQRTSTDTSLQVGFQYRLTCQFNSTVSGLPGDTAILADKPATRWRCTSAPGAAKPTWQLI
jgi:hypothetical protein